MGNNPFATLKPKSIWLHKASGLICDIPPNVLERRTGQYHHFDSQSEYSMYKRLCMNCPQVTVTRNHKLVLLPKTVRFKELAWKVDFGIALAPMLVPSIFLEFKGAYILHSSFNKEALHLRLAMAERVMLSSDRLYIVTDNPPTDIGHGYRTHTTASIISLIKGLL